MVKILFSSSLILLNFEQDNQIHGHDENETGNTFFSHEFNEIRLEGRKEVIGTILWYEAYSFKYFNH